MSVSGGSPDGLVPAGVELRPEGQGLKGPARAVEAAAGLPPDAAALLALADRIAEGIAQRLVPRLAQLLDRNWPDAAADGSGSLQSLTAISRVDVFWTARRVAAHYGVTAGFVYQHADELGCVRLGGGPCARLRFDPQVVCERWATTVGQLPAAQTKPRKGSASRPRRRRTEDPGFDLLDFDREP